MRSRYYSTDIKRFINRDVVRGSLTNSRSLNRYCYVQGNPVSCADPFGMSPYNFQFVEAHGVLDVLGIIPGLGDIATLANAGLYAMEGRTGEAVKYLAVAAAIGGGVYAAGKAVTKAAGTAGKIAKAKSTAKNFTNSVKKHGEGISRDNRGCVDFGRKGGSKTIVFNEKNVAMDNNTFNPDFVDKQGRTNIQRMEQGLSPIGRDGKSVNIHHIDQTNDGPVMEITATEHQQNYSQLHTNTGQSPSQIDRKAFNNWRNEYWKWRGNNLE